MWPTQTTDTRRTHLVSETSSGHPSPKRALRAMREFIYAAAPPPRQVGRARQAKSNVANGDDRHARGFRGGRAASRPSTTAARRAENGSSVVKHYGRGLVDLWTCGCGKSNNDRSPLLVGRMVNRARGNDSAPIVELRRSRLGSGHLQSISGHCPRTQKGTWLRNCCERGGAGRGPCAQQYTSQCQHTRTT